MTKSHTVPAAEVDRSRPEVAAAGVAGSPVVRQAEATREAARTRVGRRGRLLQKEGSVKIKVDPKESGEPC